MNSKISHLFLENSLTFTIKISHCITPIVPGSNFESSKFYSKGKPLRRLPKVTESLFVHSLLVYQRVSDTHVQVSVVKLLYYDGQSQTCIIITINTIDYDSKSLCKEYTSNRERLMTVHNVMIRVYTYIYTVLLWYNAIYSSHQTLIYNRVCIIYTTDDNVRPQHY